MCGIFLKVVLLVRNIQVNRAGFSKICIRGGRTSSPHPGQEEQSQLMREGGGGAIGEEASMPCYELFLAGEVAS